MQLSRPWQMVLLMVLALSLLVVGGCGGKDEPAAEPTSPGVATPDPDPSGDDDAALDDQLALSNWYQPDTALEVMDTFSELVWAMSFTGGNGFGDMEMEFTYRLEDVDTSGGRELVQVLFDFTTGSGDEPAAFMDQALRFWLDLDSDEMAVKMELDGEITEDPMMMGYMLDYALNMLFMPFEMAGDFGVDAILAGEDFYEEGSVRWRLTSSTNETVGGLPATVHRLELELPWEFELGEASLSEQTWAIADFGDLQMLVELYARAVFEGEEVAVSLEVTTLSRR